MKRTQRNLLVILSIIAASWILLRQLPLITALWTLGAVVLIGVILIVLARDFFIGRYRARKRDWHKALERYQRFERKLLTRRWTTLLAPLYFGIYTFDGVALVRNNIGQSLMNLDKLDEAEHWLRSALQRDPLYAIPYINLGIIAGMRGSEAVAKREIRRAVELGYSPVGAQQVMRKILARGSEGAGRMLE
jgi:tetratricopeptide (TPR) repeat protein